MLTVHIPIRFRAERRYILDILLKEYLGLDYQIAVADAQDYQIQLNNKTLHIEDHFFSKFSEEDGYLKAGNIPDKLEYFNHVEYKADKLPVLYGTAEIVNVNDGIRCQIDIFASCFFMLTRWEEYVIKGRDQHGRFPAKHALAYKEDFLDRPVVNEYVEVLRSMLLALDSSLTFKKWEFTCTPTHDIDHLQKWGSLTNIRKKLAHDFITKRRPLIGLKNVKDLLLTKMGIRKDPYNTINYIIELSKANNLTSRFYFLCEGTSKQDNNYAIEEAKPIIDLLKAEGQVVGFHPSYSSFEDREQWSREKQLLEEVADQTMSEGRQHYLRFEVPSTWQTWDDAGMKMDSTAGYSEVPGFRCGTCYPFSVFDIVNRKKLDLKENPLILMETTLISYMNLSPKEAYEIAKKLYFTVQQYNGSFTFLWHNSALHTVEDKPYLCVYENIIKGFPIDGE